DAGCGHGWHGAPSAGWPAAAGPEGRQGFAPRPFTLSEATSLFDSLFNGQDPFADFSDGPGLGLGLSRTDAVSVRKSSGAPGWDVKVTKVKRPDGTVLIERTDASGRVTRTVDGPGHGGGPGGSWSSATPTSAPWPAAPPRPSATFASGPPAAAPPPQQGPPAAAAAPWATQRPQAALQDARGPQQQPLRPAPRLQKVGPRPLPPAGSSAAAASGIRRGTWASGAAPVATATAPTNKGTFVSWSSN
ncbi:unnamed protein product, partial [Prorocentrum cordatum]